MLGNKTYRYYESSTIYPGTYTEIIIKFDLVKEDNDYWMKNATLDYIKNGTYGNDSFTYNYTYIDGAGTFSEGRNSTKQAEYVRLSFRLEVASSSDGLKDPLDCMLTYHSDGEVEFEWADNFSLNSFYTEFTEVI